jgi:hypothetical protein
MTHIMLNPSAYKYLHQNSVNQRLLILKHQKAKYFSKNVEHLKATEQVNASQFHLLAIVVPLY